MTGGTDRRFGEVSEQYAEQLGVFRAQRCGSGGRARHLHPRARGRRDVDPLSRWVPINSYVPGDPLIDGMDLHGCHLVFDVGDDSFTEITVPANLHHDGWNVDCVTGVVLPGTDAAGAVSP